MELKIMKGIYTFDSFFNLTFKGLVKCSIDPKFELTQTNLVSKIKETLWDKQQCPNEKKIYISNFYFNAPFK